MALDPRTGLPTSYTAGLGTGTYDANYVPGVTNRMGIPLSGSYGYPGPYSTSPLADPSVYYGGTGSYTPGTAGYYSPPSIPSLASILAGDPLYQQSIANLQAYGVQDQASLNAARQRAIANYGEVPGLSGYSQLIGSDFGSSLGNAGQLAQQNTAAGISTTARLADADKQAIQGITNTLSARGILQSGETGYQAGREQLQYRQASYDALQKLVDYLSGVQSAYVASQRQRQQAELQAQYNALASYLSQNPYTPTYTPGTPGSFSGAPAPSSPAPSTGEQFQIPQFTPTGSVGTRTYAV